MTAEKASLENSNTQLEKHVYQLLVYNAALRAKAGISANSVLSYFSGIAELNLRRTSLLGKQELGELSLLEVMQKPSA